MRWLDLGKAENAIEGEGGRQKKFRRTAPLDPEKFRGTPPPVPSVSDKPSLSDHSHLPQARLSRG